MSTTVICVVLDGDDDQPSSTTLAPPPPWHSTVWAGPALRLLCNEWLAMRVQVDKLPRI